MSLKKGNRPSRRQVLKSAAIAVPSAFGLGAVGLGIRWSQAGITTVGRVEFSNRLAIPPLAPATVGPDGLRTFQLVATKTTQQLRPGPATQVLGYQGQFLGPTVRANRGDRVQIQVRNELSGVTTVHWHGMHLPPKMDGGPHQLIQPGGVWSPAWTIDQPAATLWYHPHPHGATAQQVYRGLAGLFLVTDDKADSALPHQYGIDDIPLIIQDKNFTSKNQFDEGFSQLFGDVGILGDTILINGTIGAFVDVTAERCRFRILNAANSRVFTIGFADRRVFQLIGSDGGLLPVTHPMTTIQISPGERVDLIFNVEPGERIVLRSFPPDLGLDPVNERFTGGDDTFDLLEIRAATQLTKAPELPDRLAHQAEVAQGLAAGARGVGVTGPAQRRFELAGKQINGRSMDLARIDFFVNRDTTEVWEIISPFPKPHNFHVHGAQFQVLTVDGKPPPPELSGWKDTIFTPPKVLFRIAIRFPRFADIQAPLMYHCHMLYHEDTGMMGQFIVKNPTDNPLPSKLTDHHSM
jgi:blue copper oxidase